MPSKSSGKVISKVKVNKKDVVITFIDRTKLRVTGEVMASFYLYEGKELSYKEIKEIESFSASAALLKYALSLIKKGHYSEWKMREKLYAKEGSKKSDVDSVIKTLKRNDLINDEMLMLDTIEYGNERNIGKNKIIKELLDKGIFEEKINKCRFPAALEKKKAMENLPRLEKKYSKYSFEQKKQHVFRALISLGFDSDIANEVMAKVGKPNFKDEERKLDKDLEKTIDRLKRKYDGFELKNKVVTSLRGNGYKLNDILRRWDKLYGEIDC